MKIYAIAYKKSECYGHGDYGDDVVMPIASGYDGSSCNPSVFSNRKDADSYAKKAGGRAVVVELEVK